MQKKHFYSHIVDTESLLAELENMGFEESEKEQLIAIVESSIHHVVLDAILSELSEEDKKNFLKLLLVDNHDKIWDHLNSKVDKIEDKIKQAADSLTEELHKDIKSLEWKRHES